MNSKRVREIKLKHFSLSGQISSKKNDSIIQFESSLERDYSILLEYNSNVKSYLEQPLIMTYYENNKKRRYTPDFFIKELESNYDGRIVEVKYKKELENKKDILKCKFDAAKKFCDKNNLIFEIISEDQIRNEYLENCKFLWRYRYDNHHINDNDIDLILDKLHNLKKSSVINLINSLSNDDFRKAELLFLIWYLVAYSIICCDLTKKINMKSILWIN